MTPPPFNGNDSKSKVVRAPSHLPPRQNPTNQKNKKIFLIVALVLIVLGGIGFGAYKIFSHIGGKISEYEMENDNRQRARAALDQIERLYSECQEIYEKNESLYPRVNAKLNRSTGERESAYEYEKRVKREISMRNENRKNSSLINTVRDKRNDAIYCYDTGDYDRVLKLLEDLKWRKADLNSITSIYNTVLNN